MTLRGVPGRRSSAAALGLSATSKDHWSLSAACRHYLFSFDEAADHTDDRPKGHERVKEHPSVTEARTICNSCPVLTPCREWALTEADNVGVVAAMTPQERVNLRRRRAS